MGKIDVYETTEETWNSSTGEITQATKFKARRISSEKEADYIKVYKYTNTVFAFKGISLSLVPAIIEISKYMTFAEVGQLVVLNTVIKKQIASTLGVSENRVKQMIKELADADVLRRTECRGMYAVNPFICSCGEAIKTKELQAKFDYEADLMTVNKVETNLITGKTIKKAMQEVKEKQLEQLSLLDLLEEKEN